MRDENKKREKELKIMWKARKRRNRRLFFKRIFRTRLGEFATLTIPRFFGKYCTGLVHRFHFAIGRFFLVSLWVNKRAANEKELSSQLLRAVELLGKERNEEVLGGIAALENVARHSPSLYPRVMEIYAQFIQRNAPFDPPAEGFFIKETRSDEDAMEDYQFPNGESTEIRSEQEASKENQSNDDEDEEGDKSPDVKKKEEEARPVLTGDIRLRVQAVLDAIGRRTRETAVGNPFILFNSNLNELTMRGNFSNIRFENTTLSGGDFYRADLRKTIFFNSNLRGAWLGNANMEGGQFIRSDLTEIRAIEANFRTVVFLDVNMTGCRLDGTCLRNAKILTATLEQGDLSDADMRGVHLSRTSFKNASLNESRLARVDFSEACLSNADFSEAYCRDACFDGADLQGVLLYKTNLRGASFIHANLKKARLGGASLRNASISLETLKGFGWLEVEWKHRGGKVIKKENGCE